jgi:hypothetical protein
MCVDTFFHLFTYELYTDAFWLFAQIRKFLDVRPFQPTIDDDDGTDAFLISIGYLRLRTYDYRFQGVEEYSSGGDHDIVFRFIQFLQLFTSTNRSVAKGGRAWVRLDESG